MADKVQAGDGSEHGQGGKGQRPRPITVEIIKRERKTALVAWMEGGLYKRAFVPSSKVKGNDVAAAALAKCPAYGLDWAKLFSALPKPAAIANDLRRQNIWTGDDFKRNRANAIAAIMRASVNPLVEKLVKEL